MLLSSSEKPDHPWQRWTDEEWHHYQATLQALKESDAQTLLIVMYRLQDPPLSYAAIAEDMNLAEKTVRTSIARFYDVIHRRFSEGPPTQDENPM